MIEGLYLVHHPDAPGQTPVVKAAGKGQPAQTGNRLPAPALLGQVVKVNARVLHAFGGEVVIVVTVDDVPFDTRIRDTGPALQFLAEGQRKLVDIGHVGVVVISATAVPANFIQISEVIGKTVMVEDFTDAEHFAQNRLRRSFKT